MLKVTILSDHHLPHQKLLTSTLSKGYQNQKDLFYFYINLLNYGHPTYLQVDFKFQLTLLSSTQKYID